MEKFIIEILQEITRKEVFELTESEKEFLRARQDYLSNEEKKKFAKVLGKIEKKEPTPVKVKRGRPLKGRKK